LVIAAVKDVLLIALDLVVAASFFAGVTFAVNLTVLLARRASVAAEDNEQPVAYVHAPVLVMPISVP